MASKTSISICWRCKISNSPLIQNQARSNVARELMSMRSASRAVSTATQTKAKSASTKTTTGDSIVRRPVPEYISVQPSTATTTASSVKSKPKVESSGSSSATKSLAEGIRSIAPSFTETYVAYGVCEELVKECVRVADYSIPQADDMSIEIPTNDKGEHIGVSDSWWYKELGLTPTLNTWAQITFLHMYMLTVRLRCFPAEHAPTWHQHLTDHFFSTAEDRMILLHRFNSRMARNKYLKDLYVQWRGLTAAYDEGLLKGDAVLAAAVWRNVCKGDENIDLEKLAEVVSYMRSVLASFDQMPDSVLAQGDVVFGDPSSEAAVVRTPSAMLAAVKKSELTKAPAKPITR